MTKYAFKISERDNTATALEEISAGDCVEIRGEKADGANALNDIPKGHKIALCRIDEGGEIFKYGVPIGIATRNIEKGSWVHLHCVRSKYDERSSHLDAHSGAPSDIDYEQ